MDAEVGDLREDVVAPEPLLTYLRYDVSFDADSIRELRSRLSPSVAAALTPERIDTLSAMDRKENLPLWKEIGEAAAATQVDPADLPAGFDLPASRG